MTVLAPARRIAAQPGENFRLFRRLGLMIALRRQRLALARLEAEALNDIGLTPDQARAEAERHLWDVPQHWLK